MTSIGKTSTIYKLLSSSILDRSFKKIYYCFPWEIGPAPPVDWHLKFEEIDIVYLTELPDNLFFDTVEANSLLIIDDLWLESCAKPDIVRAFKV